VLLIAVFGRKDTQKATFSINFYSLIFHFSIIAVTLRHETSMLTIMSTQAMQQTIAEYFKTQPVLKAWLFGSYARGEETPLSDVDLLVVLDPTQSVGLKFFGMWNDLEQILDRSVDLVTDGSLADFARESVERDKILIYERAA
jgi:predicted nucleotidyltransferase